MNTLANDEIWLSLKEAAALFGVHPATVRRWADKEQIPFIRTPGGHRRFLTRDIQQSIQQRRQATPGIEDVWMERALVYTRSSIVHNQDQQWLIAFDEAERARKRVLGRRLMGLMLQYISVEEGGADILAEAQIIGREYATNALGLNLPLTDALSATLFFRDAIIETILDLPENVQVKSNDRKRLLSRINNLLNVVQLAVAEVYDGRFR